MSSAMFIPYTYLVVKGIFYSLTLIFKVGGQPVLGISLAILNKIFGWEQILFPRSCSFWIVSSCLQHAQHKIIVEFSEIYSWCDKDTWSTAVCVIGKNIMLSFKGCPFVS